MTFGMFLSDNSGKTFGQMATGLSHEDVANHLLLTLEANPQATAERDSLGDGFTAYDTSRKLVWRWIPESN